jgi:hypothetical protein
MPRSRLILSSVAFAILWTAFMWWWNSPLARPALIILVVVGAICGLLWYWLFGMWMRRFARRNVAK